MMDSTLEEYEQEWTESGYGVALVGPDHVVIDPYIDPSDYSFGIVRIGDNGRAYLWSSEAPEGSYLTLHSGVLEENPQFLVNRG